MNKENGKHAKLKIATAVTGGAFLLFGLGNVAEKTSTDKNITEPKNEPSEYLNPVRCKEPMPWEPDYKDNNQNQTGEIELASIQRPEPTPRNEPECWIIIRDNGTIFEQSASVKNTPQNIEASTI